MEYMQQELQPKPMPTRSQRAVKVFVIFILIITATILLVFLLGEYQHRRNEKMVNGLAQSISDMQKADYEEAMKDTFGGKTPQETLSLYITAVEKGDYELASKYFIGTKQAEELKSLKSAEEKNVKNYIEQTKPILSLGGNYLKNGKEFVFNGDILLRLKQYPNGVWKIIEI